jgi:PAS domain S-box-containing protein
MDKPDPRTKLFGDSPTLAARENAPLPIYVVDTEGGCVYVNARYCQLFEITREHALASGWLERVHPQDRHRVITERARRDSSKIFHSQYRIITSHGDILTLASASTPILNDHGKLIGRSGIVTQTNPGLKESFGRAALPLCESAESISRAAPRAVNGLVK